MILEKEVPGWSKVLNSYFVNRIETRLYGHVAFDEEIGIEYFFDDSGINVFGTVIEGGSNSIVSAEILYGVIDDSDGSIIFIGEEPLITPHLATAPAGLPQLL